MKRRDLVALAGAALVAALAILTAPEVSAQSTPSPPGTKQAFGAAFEAWAAKYHVTKGLIVVRHDGKVVYQDAVGGADPAAPVHIASLSKAVTAACVATVIRDGKLTLDTPLSKALAKFFMTYGSPADPRMLNVTIAQLLSHRSGLPDDSVNDVVAAPLKDYLTTHTAKAPPPPELLAAVFKANLVAAPGSVYAYANANYLILGQVIEEATGQPYLSYCQSAVLAPLGATGDFDPVWQVIGPFGGWHMTGEDYLKIYDLLDPKDKRLGADAKAWLLSPTGKLITNGGGAWYGLGVDVRKAGSGYTFWHWGGWQYSLKNSVDGAALTTSFVTLAIRTNDGTGWFVYAAPFIAVGAPRTELENATFAAFNAIKNWN